MKLPSSDLDHVLTHTGSLWEELRGQRIFITGGTGFFGCWLLETFAWANEKLNLQASAVVLTRGPQAFAAKMPHLAGRADITLVAGDVRSFTFPSGSFSQVIHAGTTSSGPVAPREMFDTIMDGTRRVLDFATASGVQKLLFVSSGAVYGRQPAELTQIPESFTGGPELLAESSAYGEGKRAAELLSVLHGQQHGCAVKIARCFAFVGPHLPLDAHFAIGNFIRDGLRGGPIRVGGDGMPCRSYLYAADLAVWLWTILLRGAAGEAYNVGSEKALTIKDIAGTVAAVFEPARTVEVAREPVPGSPAQRYIPNTTRAQQTLGLEQRIDLPEAIRRTIAWTKTNMHQTSDK